MRLSDYKEDQAKQEGGSPFYLGDGCFYVRRFGTAKTNKQIEDIKRNEYGFAPKNIDGSLVLAIWLCEYGVTGWDGVLDEEDNELKYSKSNARKIFMNPSYFGSLNPLLINHASDYASYLHDEIEADIEEIKKS